MTGADDEGVNDVAGFEWVPSLNAILFAVEVVTGKHSNDVRSKVSRDKQEAEV